jgi:hypothetical protein
MAVHTHVGFAAFRAGAIARKRHPLNARLPRSDLLVGVFIRDHGFYSMLGGRLDDFG